MSRTIVCERLPPAWLHVQAIVLCVGQDLHILLLAAVGSRVILPSSETIANNNHFMEITRSLCLDLK